MEEEPAIDPGCSMDATRILNDSAAGGTRDTARLIELVYDQLRVLARA